MTDYYRFRVTSGLIAHLWKSATRQDHVGLRATISPHLPKNGVAIDVGAHGGQITRLLAKMVPAGQVIAVEPNSYTRSILRMAIWSRGCRNVMVVATALGAKCGTALIRTPIKRRGDMGYGLSNLLDGGAHSIAELVPVVTLDALVEELGLSRLDFIKADIEGFEAELISGAHEALTKFRPALLLEMDDIFLRRAGSSLESLWNELLCLGYLPHGTDGARLTGPEKIDSDVLWLPDRRLN